MGFTIDMTTGDVIESRPVTRNEVFEAVEEDRFGIRENLAEVTDCPFSGKSEDELLPESVRNINVDQFLKEHCQL